MNIIADKNFSRQDTALDGPTTFIRCNLVLAHITTNGHEVQFDGCNKRGVYIDEVKQDDYILRVMGKWATAEAILTALDSAGKDAIEAWKVMAQVVQSGSPTMTWTDFRTAYSANVPPDNHTYSAALLATVASVVAPNNQTWEAARGFIRAHSFESLTGQDTEIVEEYA